MGWSGRRPAYGARGWRRGAGVLRTGAKFLTCAGLGTRGPGLKTRRRGTGVPKWNSAGSPHPVPTPHRAPGWGSVGKRGKASLPDRQKKPLNGEQWPNFLKEKKKRRKKKGEKKCLDQWGIYAKTHMICNVSMRICIRYHYPSCHPDSGSAESYKVKFSPLRRRRRNVIFRRQLRGRLSLKVLVTSQGCGVGSKLT